MRLFEKSEYEKKFEDRFVLNYKCYDIYEYQSFDRERFTFWVSSEDSDYYSSIGTIDECKSLIDRIVGDTI